MKIQSRTHRVTRAFLCVANIFALVLTTGAASAALKTKINARDWIDPTAWESSGAPSADDAVILKAAASPPPGQSVTLTSLEVNETLSVGKDTGLRVTQNVVVGGELQSGGTFEVNGENAAISIGQGTFGGLYVGSGSTGKMIVSEGSVTTVDELVVGGGPGSGLIDLGLKLLEDPGFQFPRAEGNLTISGPASIVSSASLKVGSLLDVSGLTVRSLAATGEVTISDGGQLLSLHRAGQPVSKATGLILEGNKIIVEDAGSTWQSDSSTRIEGALTIRNGGKVMVGPLAGDLSIGATRGASEVASVTVDGTGSTLTVTRDLEFHPTNREAGALNVTRGGQVNSVNVALGTGGVATVSGQNSLWSNDKILQVNNFLPFGQPAALTIADGAAVVTTDAVIGNGDGGLGATLMVTGASSTLLVKHDLIVGFGNPISGIGASLAVRNGGQVISAFGFIGSGEAIGKTGFNGGLGTASVEGAGSVWAVSDSLTIGSRVNGALAVSDGGKVSANVVYLGQDPFLGVPGKPGTINIGAAAAQTATQAGTLDIVDDINIGSAGTINFNHTEANYHFSEAVESTGFGQGVINQINGTTTLDGDLDRFTGQTHVQGGTLIVNTVFGSTTVTVESGATLGGSGNVENLIALDGATIVPGNSPGVLTVNGNFTLNAGARLEMQIAGTAARTEYDALDVRGNVILKAGSLLELTFLKGFAPQAGQQFSLFDVDGVFANEAAIEIGGLEPGWLFDTNFDAIGGKFTLNSLSDGVAVSAVPVTVPPWLMVSAVGGLSLLRRRSFLGE